jgi:hypothetical protein
LLTLAKVANVILGQKISSAFIDPRRVGGLIGYGQDNEAKLLTKDELERKLAKLICRIQAIVRIR